MDLRTIGAWLAVVSLAAAGAAAARAETIEVNSRDDRPDADPGDGICDADLSKEGEQRTLRAAIQHANATPGADVVVLPAGRYKLRIRGAGEQSSATGDLDVTDDLEISGAGAATTVIDGVRAKDRVLDLRGGNDVRISGVTIRGGKSPRDESGGGVRCAGPDVAIVASVVTKCRSRDDAGGIDVRSGTVTVLDSWISKNTAADDGGGLDVDDETVIVERSAVTGNKAGDEGGGLENSGGSLTLRNSTVGGNRAKSAAGISLEDGGTLTLEFCTVASNKARSGGALTTNDEEFGRNAATARGCLVARNGKKTCVGALTSLGGNVEDTTTCGFTREDDREGVKLKLGALKASGALAPTYAPPASSPAIAFVETGCPETDQRGVARTAPCDAGAHQSPRAD